MSLAAGFLVRGEDGWAGGVASQHPISRVRNEV